MGCPWIGRWMVFLVRSPWLSGMPWKKISMGQDDSAPEDQRQEGAPEFQKLHQLW
jgi:hypothetical protein